MSEERAARLSDITEGAIRELDEYWNDEGGKDDPYQEDRCHEIADSWVPVYTYELLQMAADNLDLAHIEPECGPAFDGSATPINIIAANIYEALSNALHEHLYELQAGE
jgi:hypothetical protein